MCTTYKFMLTNWESIIIRDASWSILFFRLSLSTYLFFYTSIPTTKYITYLVFINQGCQGILYLALFRFPFHIAALKSTEMRVHALSPLGLFFNIG